MDNPQANNYSLTAREIYQYDNHTNIPWNLSQYRPERKNFDAKAVIQQRFYLTQKKGVKTNDFHITKRGFYMDYDLKVAKSIPSSVEHVKQQPWDGTHHDLADDQLKIARSLKKNSYLEQIQHEQAKRPIPGIGKYKLEKSLEDLQAIIQKNKSKKINIGEKRYFYEDVEHVSDRVPGAGHYNPHDSVDHLKKTKGNWQEWIKKHAKLNKTQLMRESKMPAAGTYNPISQSAHTFELLSKKPKKQLQIKNGFGSDARFPYVRKNKKVILEQRPAPWTYQTKIQWKDKSASPTKKEWIKQIWTGSPPKVYH